MSVEDIYNFIRIDDRIATAGQPTAEQFRAAEEAGYEVVINLAPDGLDTSLAGEAELLRDLGIDYRHIPVPWSDPTVDQLGRFEGAMAEAGERRTLIHCQANFRVTAFFAMYAEARLGWSAAEGDALIDRIWSSRPGFSMDETWQGFIAKARARA